MWCANDYYHKFPSKWFCTLRNHTFWFEIPQSAIGPIWWTGFRFSVEVLLPYLLRMYRYNFMVEIKWQNDVESQWLPILCELIIISGLTLGVSGCSSVSLMSRRPSSVVFSRRDNASSTHRSTSSSNSADIFSFSSKRHGSGNTFIPTHKWFDVTPNMIAFWTSVGY